MAATTTPSQNTGINITVQNESENYRNIRRNSSKQIVSYTLPEDSDKEYGYKRIPGTTTEFDSQVYNRTIPQLSNELITPLPEFTNEVIEQNFVLESKMYYVVGTTLQPIRGEEIVEPEDKFSGRYELSPNANSARDKTDREEISPGSAFHNSHFSGVSYHNDGVRNATDGFLTSGGRKPLQWDTKAYGPPLQNFGYRITKELIESGRNLNIRAVVSFSLVHSNGNNVGAYARIQRQRAGDFSAPTYGFSSKGQDYVTPAYPMLQCVLDIPNEDLVEGDLFQISSIFGSVNDGVFIYGHKSVFEVTAQLPEEPPIVWPPDLEPTAEPNSNPASSDADEAEPTQEISNG